MSAPVLFLDGNSRYRESIDRQDAELTAKALITTLRSIKKINRKFALNTEGPLSGYQIAENWTLQAVLGGNAFKEEWDFLRDLNNRSPLSTEVEAFLNDIDCVDCRTHPGEIKSIPLAWATVLDSGVVSFKGHVDWSNPWVETRYQVLEDDATINDKEGKVRNASDPVHAQEHAGWLQSVDQEESATAAQVWGERLERFPRLRLLARVEKDLLDLSGSGAPYRQALSKLSALSDDANNWREGDSQPIFSTHVTPEHEQRRQLCWWDDEATGKNELFEWHGRFTGDFAGRIHFRCDAPVRSIVVAYVGKKL